MQCCDSDIRTPLTPAEIRARVRQSMKSKALSQAAAANSNNKGNSNKLRRGVRHNKAIKRAQDEADGWDN